MSYRLSLTTRNKNLRRNYHIPNCIQIQADIAEIGIGNQGIVWPGTYTDPVTKGDSVIAIKDIGRLGTAVNAKKAFRELYIFKRISHPNIVKYITSFGRNDYANLGYFCIAMEKCDMTMYPNAFAKKYCNLYGPGGYRFPTEFFRDIAFQLLCGTKFVNDCGLMHRDIKPSNIGIIHREDKSPLVKLLDFGLSRDELHAQMVGTRDSTPSPFRAPELLEGSQQYDCKIDAWSVGCVLFRLATNKLPFDYTQQGAETFDVYTSSILSKIQNYTHDAYEASGVPDDARGLIARLLVKDPTERASAADALEDIYFSGLTDRVANQAPPIGQDYQALVALHANWGVNDIKECIVAELDHRLDF